MDIKQHFKTAGYALAFTGGTVVAALAAHAVVHECVSVVFKAYDKVLGDRPLPTSGSNPNYPQP